MGTDRVGLYGDIMSSYSRAEAIADGTLIDVTGPMTLAAGIKVPVAFTAAAHATCVALTEAAKRARCDVDGRLWDVLTMFTMAAMGAQKSEIPFSVRCIVDSAPEMVALKATIGPGDDARAVITIMLPEED